MGIACSIVRPSPVTTTLFTPSDVFFGRVALVATARQAALNLAYRAHPERFPHGAPRVALPPAAVHINPLTADALQLLAGPATPEETSTPTSIMNSRLRVCAALRRQAPVAGVDRARSRVIPGG
jgi:hypothetical protein